MSDSLPSPFQKSKQFSFPAGTVFISPEDGEQYAWLLVKGQVRQFDILDDGSEFSLNIYKTGSIFSLTWLLGGCENVYFYEAHEDSIVARIDASTYQNYIEAHPEEALAILKRLSRGLDGVFSRLSVNSKNDAAARVLNEIRMEGQRFGRTDMPIRISNNALANRTGLARETVSRTVSKLIDNGTLHRTKAGLEIKSRDN